MQSNRLWVTAQEITIIEKKKVAVNGGMQSSWHHVGVVKHIN